MDKAGEYGLIPRNLLNTNLKRAATRAELAAILALTLPEEALTPINETPTLHDYGQEDLYWQQVLLLYRAGVLTGDSGLMFSPHRSIRRSELATILARLARPEYRITVTAQGEKVGMEAFHLPERLPVLTFSDVSRDDWYYTSVQRAYALGLVSGISDTAFDPNGRVRLNQAVAVAVRIYEKYYGLADRSQNYGEPWYRYYMDRATDYGILTPEMAHLEPEQILTREEMAAILAGALPSRDLSAVKEVPMLPDYDESDRFWPRVQMLYEAGVLVGQDHAGTFGPGSPVRRSELAALLTRLVLPERRERKPLTPYAGPKLETIAYGSSSQGRQLNAYRIGDGDNVLVVTFAIHGWEDNFPRDGMLLMQTGQNLRTALVSRLANVVESGNWTVYVLPCLNPDGLYEGWTQNGPGRCTIASLYEDGTRREVGIDMNRSFPYNYRLLYGARNENGTAPLQAPEAQALAAFTESVMGQGYNVLVDTHGWYQEVILNGSWYHPIYQAFYAYFPYCSQKRFGDASGYFSAWACYELGYDGALFEFPGVTTMEAFYDRGYGEDYINAIGRLLETYE